MILTLGVFLFNLLCGLVPCDPKYQTPEILSVPKDQSVRARNIATQNVPPIVETLSGALEGYVMRSTIGRDFFAFEGTISSTTMLYFMYRVFENARLKQVFLTENPRPAPIDGR